jgi:benzoyl-CoA reductase/2-hydroxyglutaryl-CoA dehydratase subunit BcrC/BadD/HgdB
VKLSKSDGLIDNVAASMNLAHYLPAPLLRFYGRALASLGLLPPDLQSGAEAMFAPRVGKASAVFMKMTARWIRAAKNAERNGKKVILVPFNFPVELLHAFDTAVPLTSEVLTTLGVMSLQGQGQKYWDMAMGMGLPDHICSSNTIELGSMLGTADLRPHAIVSSAPGSCDANAKIHEFVANQLDIPHFFLQKPPDDSQRGRRAYLAYARNLVSQLEEFLGEKLREERFREVMEKANRCTELYGDLFDLQRAVPSPVPNIFSLFIAGTRFTVWGTDDGIRALESMIEVARERLARGAYPAEKEVARCLWVYTSYYFDLAGFYNWMEERGYSHLGDVLTLFFPRVNDTSSMESMLEGFADAAASMPMTRQMGAESMSGSWVEDMVWAARELGADCAVYCGHHSCKQTWSVVSILRKELMNQAGIPLLTLQGDSWMKRMTPMSALQQEMTEFVENVVTRKEAPRRKLRRRRKATAAEGGP